MVRRRLRAITNGPLLHSLTSVPPFITKPMLSRRSLSNHPLYNGGTLVRHETLLSVEGGVFCEVSHIYTLLMNCEAGKWKITF